MTTDLPTEGRSQIKRRVAVVVVHGVGDTAPGAALNELVGSLESNFKDEFKAENHSQVHQLKSPPTVKGEPTDTFPAYARCGTLTATGDRIWFYDLHWADLTRSLPGRFNAFLGGFRIIFEAHHFIDAMLPKGTRGSARVLRILLLWAAAILRGPIVGLSAFLVLTGLVYYFSWGSLSQILGRDPQGIQIMWFIVVLMITTLIVALFLFYYRGRPQETEWNDVLAIIVYGSLAVSGYVLYEHYPALKAGAETGPMFRPCSYILRLYFAIQVLRVIWCLLLLLSLPVVAWLYLRAWIMPSNVKPSSAIAAVSVVVLQSALWLSLISAFSIPLIHQAELFKRLGELETCGLEGLYISASGTVFLLIGVGLLAALTYLARFLISRLPLVGLDWRSKLTPRMLFGALITAAILLGMFVQILFFVVSLDHSIRELVQDISSGPLSSTLAGTGARLGAVTGPSQPVQDTIAKVLFPVGYVLALLVSLLIAFGFTTAIHITRDLIDHQYSPRRGFAHFVLPTRWRGRPDKPRRIRIRHRLNALARDLICNERFDDLVFVVHSQGSVIAYDFLRAGGEQCEQLLNTRPHMVTMGTPLGHLYQYYFKEYAELGKGIEGLCPRLGSWINLYRTDDYVGRRIDVDPATFIRNQAMPAGGHTNYWTERAISQVIFDCIRTPTAGSSAAGS